MADGRLTIEVLMDDKGAVQGVRGLEGVMNGVTNTAQKVTGGMKSIVGALGLVKIASSAFNVLKSSMDAAINRVDTLNRFPQMMQAMGFSAEESAASIKTLSEGIQGLPTRLDEVAANTQQLAILTGDLDLATKTTLALNNAFLASGSSSADAERGLTQYVQMLSRGEVDMQSWRTLQETMGVALNDTAKAFGFAGESAQNDLYEALKDGTITFDDFNAKIVELSDGVGGFAERALIASKGIKTSMQNIKTAVATGLANLIQTVNDTMEAGGFGSIADNLDKVKVAVQKTFKELNASLTTFIPMLLTFVQDVNGVLQIGFNEGIQEAGKAGYDMMMFYLDQAYSATDSPLLKQMLDVVFEALKGNKLQARASAQVLITDFISGFLDNAEQLAQAGIYLVQDLINGIVTAIPIMLEVGTTIINGLLLGLLQGLPIIQTAGTSIITAFFKGLRELLPQLPEIASVAMNTFIQSLEEHFPLITERGIEMINRIITGLTETLPILRENAGQLIATWIEGLTEAFGIITENGVQWVIHLITGIVEGSLLLAETAFGLVADFIISLNENLPSLLESGKNFVFNLIDGITEALPDLGEKAVGLVEYMLTVLLEEGPKFIMTAWNWVMSLIQGLAERMPALLEKGLEIVNNLLRVIMEKIPEFLKAGLDMIADMITGMGQKEGDSEDKTIEIINIILDAIKTFLGNFLISGEDLIKALNDGMENIREAIKQKAKDLMQAVLDEIKGFFKRMFGAGEDTAGEVEDGISRGKGGVSSATEGMMDGALSKVTGRADDFMHAGATIANKIGDGISGAWKYVTEKASALAGKIMGFFPQSPAKEGPLRGLEHSDFGGQIGQALERSKAEVQASLNNVLELPDIGKMKPRFATSNLSTYAVNTYVKPTDNSEIENLLREFKEIPIVVETNIDSKRISKELAKPMDKEIRRMEQVKSIITKGRREPNV